MESPSDAVDPSTLENEHAEDEIYVYQRGSGRYEPPRTETRSKQTWPLSMFKFTQYQAHIPEKFVSSAPKETTHARVAQGVTKIETYAFADTRLESIRIPEGVEIIERGAFEDCTNLVAIELPASLKCIESKAFCYCTNLKSVRFKEKTKREAFRDNKAEFCRDLSEVQVDGGLQVGTGLKIGKYAFSHCENLSKIELPSCVDEIDAMAFYSCASLTSIDLSEVEKIANDAFSSCYKLASLTIPASLEVENTFDLLTFLLKRLPWLKDVKFEETDKAKKERIQNNTVIHQLIENKCPIHLIEAFLESCPSVIKERNYLGQTPLHLCLANGSSPETTKLIYDQWPEALQEVNEIGQSPVELWENNGSDSEIGDIIGKQKGRLEFFLERLATVHQLLDFTTRKRLDAFVLRDNEAVCYEAPVLLRCEHILLEVADSVADRSITHHGKQKDMREYFSEQLVTRNILFGSLLDEFASLIEFQEKQVIQQAAALQALKGDCIPKDVPIDFSKLSSSAWWYQQEILKLVLRVYHEDRPFCEEMTKTNDLRPDYSSSILDDAIVGKQDMEEKRMEIGSYRKDTFIGFKNWIVDGCDGKCKLQGPVPKTLQSLFNKMYIRRGQTNFSIIGDMTRATLWIDKEEDLKRAIEKIENEFPNLKEYKSPAEIGLAGYLEQITGFGTIDLPNTKLIPYRLKVNSSQKGKRKKELYNLNFFDRVPEYHRVGNTEMFVAFELQIGLSSEIERLRKDHISYERNRILDAQPLLKNYIEVTQEESNDGDHSKLISAILQGNFSSFNLGALAKEKIKGEGTTFRRPKCLCINNKRFNIWADKGKAFIIDEVTSLDPSLRYSVESLLLKTGLGCSMHFGLFARIGSYIVSVSSSRVSEGTRHFIIEPELNPETLERISPLPLGCEDVYLIAWDKPGGIPWEDVQDIFYNGMELVLCRYEDMNEKPPLSVYLRWSRELKTGLYRFSKRWYYDSKRWHRNYTRNYKIFQKWFGNLDNLYVILVNVGITALCGYASWHVYQTLSTTDLIASDRNVQARTGLAGCFILISARRVFVFLLFVLRLGDKMLSNERRRTAVAECDWGCILALLPIYYGAIVLFRDASEFVYQFVSSVWTGVPTYPTGVSIIWVGLKFCSFFGSGWAIYVFTQDLVLSLIGIAWMRVKKETDSWFGRLLFMMVALALISSFVAFVLFSLGSWFIFKFVKFQNDQRT